MRVLIVDDAATFRLAITEALARIPGVEVVGSAPNGQIALRKARELEPDVVLLDVEMPVMDGLETLKALRTERPESAVLMFSAHTRRGRSRPFRR